MTRLILSIFSALIVFSSPAVAADKPVVYVPVLPYEWLFERVGGDWIDVKAIVGEGDDAHDYSPTPKQLTRIAGANLVFSGNLGFEGNFFVKLGDGKDAPKEIDLLEGLDLLEGSCSICETEHEAGGEHSEKEHEEEEHEEEHDHEHHDHDHGDLKDPHVWLSPKMLIQQATRVGSILKEFTPKEAAPEIDANVAKLTEELTALDQEIAATLEPIKGQVFYVYHGAFSYFAQSYGLVQKAVEVTGRRPSPKQLASIAEHAKKDGVKVIFVQPQFDQSAAASLAETIGGSVKELDPLEKDVIANLKAITATLQEIRE